MGFKLPGKSIQTGTSGHSSALKMKVEANAVAKMKAAAKMYKNSPMDKALVGDQKNLPDHLKAEIEAAPGKMVSPAKETFSQAYRKNRNAGENTFTYKGKSYSTESASEKEKRGGKGEYKNKRAKAKATTTVQDDVLTKNIKDQDELAADNTTTKGPKEGPREGTKEEKVAVVKDNLKDTKKQNKINTLKAKKDVADTKGKSKRSQRLANKIERKESRQDGDKSTNVSRRDQRKARKATKTKNAQETINRKNQDDYKESQKNTSSGNLKGSLANNEVKSTTKIKGSLS